MFVHGTGLKLTHLLTGALLLCILWPSSAAAQKIAYVSARDGDNRLVSLDLVSGQETDLMSGLPGTGSSPQWSPDGSQVVFSVDPAGGIIPSFEAKLDIYRVNADGSGLLRLTDSPGFDIAPRWSPDGTRIMFVSARDGNDSIYVMNADGSGVEQLTVGIGETFVPRWSPDGSQILFGLYDPLDPDTADIGVYIINADGSNLTNVSNMNVSDPVGFDGYADWSPDGSRIAFSSTRSDTYEVYVVNVDGSGLINITNSPGTAELDPKWSPDGTRITYRGNLGGTTNVYVVDPDGSNLINVTAGEDGSSPQWSPDGSKLLFITSRDRQSEIYMANPDGSEPTNLTNFAGNDRNFDPFGNFGVGTPPSISAGGVVLANLAPLVKKISPLSIISVFGTNFSEETVLAAALDSEGALTRQLAGTCFEIAGQRTPAFAVTPNQGNIQVPSDAPFGPTAVEAISNCGGFFESRSLVETVMIEEATPAFFLFEPVIFGGFIAARFNDTATGVAPRGQFEDQYGPSRPVIPGEIIVLYGTGWGKTVADLGTGELATGAAELLPEANPFVVFDGVIMAPEDVFYVGATPGTAGLYQLVIRVPLGTQTGNKKVVLNVYGKPTPIGPVIPVEVPL